MNMENKWKLLLSALKKVRLNKNNLQKQLENKYIDTKGKHRKSTYQGQTITETLVTNIWSRQDEISYSKIILLLENRGFRDDYNEIYNCLSNSILEPKSKQNKANKLLENYEFFNKYKVNPYHLLVIGLESLSKRNAENISLRLLNCFKLVPFRIENVYRCLKCFKTFPKPSLADILGTSDPNRIKMMHQCPTCGSKILKEEQKILIEVDAETSITDINHYWNNIKKHLKGKYRQASKWERDLEWYNLHKNAIKYEDIAKLEYKKNKDLWDKYIKSKYEKIVKKKPYMTLEQVNADFLVNTDEHIHTQFENLIRKAVSRIEKKLNK